jgi:hypothetical protein
LTDITSVKLGIGPVCRAKGILEDDKQGELFMVEAIEGFNEDIVCSRDEDGIHTNVPRRIIYHSPDGFEWGYGGSGPADFALNILSVFIGQEAAQRGGLYQAFKFDFIAPMPKEGGTIKRGAILAWIEKKKQVINER